MLKNIETKKLQKLAAVRRTDTEFKVSYNAHRRLWQKVPLSSQFVIFYAGAAGAVIGEEESRKKPKPSSKIV